MSEVSPLLEADHVYCGYGSTDILHDVGIKLYPGEIVSIVGPNGAGKSTLMKGIFGLIGIRKGSVTFDGGNITRLRADQVVRRGMCYVPQEYNVFPSLSVRENLEMGGFIRTGDISESIERVFQLFPPLLEKTRQSAGTLSGGQRQMVAIGRALMLEPSLLLLDEPSAGLSPLFVDEIFERIRAINDSGVGILMVEQNARRALELSDRGYVLAMGRNRHEDTAQALLDDPHIAEMFLGG